MNFARNQKLHDEANFSGSLPKIVGATGSVWRLVLFFGVLVRSLGFIFSGLLLVDLTAQAREFRDHLMH